MPASRPANPAMALSMEALLAQLKFKRSAAGAGAMFFPGLWTIYASRGKAALAPALISGEQAEQTALRLSSGLRDSFRGRLQHFNAKSTVAVARSVGRASRGRRSGLLGRPVCGIAVDGHDE